MSEQHDKQGDEQDDQEQPQIEVKPGQGTEGKANKELFKGSITREQETDDDQPEQQKPKVDKSLSHRSAHSAERNGQNQQQGEPTPGYGTEAPQVQGGGKR